jgi:mevalonate kinase
MGRAFGHGKVILLGEHAVVYGVPAIAAGLARGVHAGAEPAEEATLAITPWDVEVRPGDGTELGDALSAVLARLEPGSLRIEAEVELPAGAGLGCSAALGVATVRAILDASGRSASDDEVAEHALAWERVFHGNPSGIDNTLAAHGGVVRFQKGAPLEVVRLRRPIHLVVGNSGESASTKRMVEGVAHQRDRDPERFDKTLQAVRSLVDNARVALDGGDLYSLGQLMNLNQALLSSLLLSTDALEAMCTAAREAGARGAKLTGSGGGGCMIALCDDPAQAEAVARAIEKTGHEAFATEVGR